MGALLKGEGWGSPRTNGSTSDEKTTMRLVLQIPSTFQNERIYVLKELLADIRGVEWVEQVSQNLNTVIIDTHGNQLLIMDGLFLGDPLLPWQRFRRPAVSIPQVMLHDDELEQATGYSNLPVLFGNTKIPPVRFISRNKIEISADLLGGTFWLLSRVEELDEDQTDPHGRYPSDRLWMVESGIILRAVVDEYRAILNYCLSRLWPGLKITHPNFQLVLSHDMDHPTSRTLGLRGFVRQLGKDVLHRRAPLVAIKRILSGLGLPGTEWVDPGSGVPFLLGLAKHFDLTPCYYWMVPEGATSLDGRYTLSRGAAHRMLQQITNAGHAVGIHPGYNTYKNPDLLKCQVESFRDTLDKIGISNSQIVGRQHYLRWRPETWSHYCKAGIIKDASIGFSDRIGFRCGTIRPYQAFDLNARRPLPLMVEPLHVMDNVIGMQLPEGPDPSIRRDLKTIHDVARRFGGSFSILWHNNSLSTPKEKQVMIDIITQLSGTG